MKLPQFIQLIFSNKEIALVNIFNRTDLNNCLKSN